MSKKRLVKRHKPDTEEIQDLLEIVERDISNASGKNLDPVWRLAMAHNAIIQSAAAALRASGFRGRQKNYHKTLITSLRFTIGLSDTKENRLQKLRRKRNIGTYDKPDPISEKEAEAALNYAKEIRDRVVKWLKKSHPHLLGEDGRGS